MGDPARDLPGFDDLYTQIQRLPEHVTGEILEPGLIRTMGRPGARHQYASRRILHSLAAFDSMEGGRSWWFEIEREIRFGVRLAVPDIAGWRAEDAPEFVEGNPIVVVPGWCCEILSPSTARDDRHLKLPLYAAQGVEWIWLVDPSLRSVEVYQAREQLPALVRTAKDDDSVTLPPFEASFDVGRYWKRAPQAAHQGQ